MYTISKKGLALIKQFEGCRLTAYTCAAGVLTIGYGHTGNVRPGQRISQSEAEALLLTDLARFEAAVNRYVKVSITQSQFDALVSFSYNIGTGALQKSTLLKKLNQCAYKEAADEFLRWNKAGGKVLSGLTVRRKKERELFLSESFDKPKTAAPVFVSPDLICNKVTASSLHIRQNPSSASAILGSYPRNSQIDILGSINNWYLTGKGYVSASYISTARAATTARLNVRDGAGTDYTVLKTLPAGTAVSLLREHKGWYLTPEGWVCGDYLTPA